MNQTKPEPLKPGDKISCQELTVTIQSITFQEWYQDTGFLTEFTDTEGSYRSWKQYLDGGDVIPA